MTLYSNIYKLNPDKLLKLKTVLTDTALAYELGTDTKQVIRRAKNLSTPGYERRLYNMLYNMTKTQLEALSKVVEREFGGNNGDC